MNVRNPPHSKSVYNKQHKKKAFKAISAKPKSIRDCIYYYRAGVLKSEWQTWLYMHTRSLENSTNWGSMTEITVSISDSRAQQRLGSKS